MTATSAWQPRHDDPLFILAMDHRASFGKTLFAVKDDNPDEEQLAAMKSAKRLIFEGLAAAVPKLTSGRPGVLVDELYGQAVIDAARDGATPVVLAVPVEASGHDWFMLQWGDEWTEHVERIRPDYAKVLVRDNPAFDPVHRAQQFADLSQVSAGLRGLGVPLIYELLVPATPAQLDQAGGSVDAYDRDIRPGLVATVIADNQAHGVAPTLWKVEGLETVDAARQVAGQARSGDQPADLIVLGRDAPAERLDRWLTVASQVPEFVGFAIGRSIWEDVVRSVETSGYGEAAVAAARAEIATRYLGFVAQWNPTALTGPVTGAKLLIGDAGDQAFRQLEARAVGQNPAVLADHVTRVEIPDDDPVSIAGRDQCAAWGEGERAYRAPVAGQGGGQDPVRRVP
jgi:myo-inositol catabolism protein IolC